MRFIPVLELLGAVAIVLASMLVIDMLGYRGPNNYEGMQRYKDASRYLADGVRP